MRGRSMFTSGGCARNWLVAEIASRRLLVWDIALLDVKAWRIPQLDEVSSMSKSYSLALGIICAIIAAILLAVSASPLASIAAVFVVLAALLLVTANKQHFQSHAIHVSSGGNNNPKAEFASGTLLEATMSGMREGLLIVDRDMRVVASNSAAHRLFTLANGSPNKKRLTELTRNPAIYDAFLDALKGIERSGVKVEIHEPDRRIFDLRVVPLGENGAKETEGALGVFFDISRLERLERVRQEFLSNVANEIRTPVTPILAFVETLETGTLEETNDNRRFLAIIRKNAERMLHLIDD